MIRRNEAEQLAAAIHAVRADWPLAQLMTLIGDLKDWPLRGLGVALMFVALDQEVDGTWVSNTPYRVKEQGPWHTITDQGAEAARARAKSELEQRRAEIAKRNREIAACGVCDSEGRLDNGNLCRHEDVTYRADRTRQLAAIARSNIRPTITTPGDEQ